MEKINVTLAAGAIMPTRGTDGSAGYNRTCGEGDVNFFHT